jgi:hypothetical protein
MHNEEDIALWKGLLLGVGLGLAFWLTVVFLFSF